MSSNQGSQVGTARDGPSSATALLWTIIPSVLVGGAIFTAFVILQKRLRHIYLPRTYLGVFRDVQRIAWNGVGSFFKAKDIEVLHHHGLDAYLFLRFFFFAFFVSAVGIPLTWIILMPVYGTASAGQSQLDVISFSNIDPVVDANRLYATSLIAIITMLFFLCSIFRERLYALKVTFAYELTPLMSSTLASRTVLLTNVDKSQECSEAEEKMRKHMWPANGGKELQDLVDDQTKIINKLEGAYIKWVQASNKKSKGDNHNDVENNRLDPDQRPTSRFISFKLIGRKTDVISWCQKQLTAITQDLDSKQTQYNDMRAEDAPAQFVEFSTKAAAFDAYSSRQKITSKNSEGRMVGAGPDEIIWKNLEMGQKQRKARGALVVAIIILMIIFWGPITAVIGAISNISYLTSQVPFLSFINQIPQIFLGAITGFLPALLLSLLMSLVPFIMRFLFKLAGAVTTPELELKVQTWYFVFQVIQVFLITTLSSGAASVAAQIVSNPTVAVRILAQNLPKASNFYIAYLVLQGVAFSSKELLAIGPLLMFFVGKITDKTPRKLLYRYTKVRNVQWGTYYPKFENFVVIAFAYSCISPLILAFSMIAFALLYLSFRYVLMFASDVVVINTHGQAYVKALNQMTTGIYLSELCLIGLMAINTASNTAAVGPLVLMILLLGLTIILHIVFNATFKFMEHKAADLASTYKPTVSSHNDSETDAKNDHAVSFSQSLQRAFDGSDDENESKVSAGKNKFTSKTSRFFLRFLFVPQVDPFPSFFSKTADDLPADGYRDAYIHPAAINSPPLLWIARAGGESEGRERLSEFRDLVKITDDSAWLGDDKKKKVRGTWMDAQSDGQEREALRKTPLWDDIRHDL